jgi:hypothetical protein
MLCDDLLTLTAGSAIHRYMPEGFAVTAGRCRETSGNGVT